MKKNILVLAALLLSGAYANAQQTVTPSAANDNRDQFGFGIKGGVNFANVYDEEGEDFVADGRTGWFAGAFVSVPLGTLFGIQPEVMYSTKGFKARGNVLGLPYSFERETAYLDIPLQLQIKPAKCLTLLVGPQFSYLLETKDRFNDGLITNVQQQEINGDNYKKNTLGIVGGVEAHYNGFLITARGAFDLTESDRDGNSYTPRYRNYLIQLGVGYTFY